MGSRFNGEEWGKLDPAERGKVQHGIGERRPGPNLREDSVKVG